MRSNKKLAPSKKEKSPTYLREIVIRYEKKKTGSKSPLGKQVQGARQIVQLFRDLQNEGKEKLIVVSLDSKLKILCFETVAVGSANVVYANPSEIFRSPVVINATGIVIIHNHPSGDPEPSDNDKDFTRRLRSATLTLGLELHDHIIVGHKDYFSFFEEGLLDGKVKDPWK